MKLIVWVTYLAIFIETGVAVNLTFYEPPIDKILGGVIFGACIILLIVYSTMEKEVDNIIYD